MRQILNIQTEILIYFKKILNDQKAFLNGLLKYIKTMKSIVDEKLFFEKLEGLIEHKINSS